jgi:hypothetical protein
MTRVNDATIRVMRPAEARSEPAVFLEGNPAYYKRFGFVAAGEPRFIRPSVRIPEPAFQVRRLQAWPVGLRGQLVYQDAFWLTDSVGLRRTSRPSSKMLRTAWTRYASRIENSAGCEPRRWPVG